MSERDKSELERGLQSLGRAFTGVAGRLLGPKAIGREELPPGSSISPEADAALEKAGADLGRLLHVTGEGLKAHPLDPSEAFRTARASSEEPIADPGWTPLAAGLKNLGGGLAKVAEGVLDVVAPRKPKDGADAESGEDDTGIAAHTDEGGTGAA